MNPNALAKDYRLIKPGERLALIMSAYDRGDAADGERLASSAPKITFDTRHHQPFAHAFREVESMWFLQLLDTSANYLEGLDLSDSLSISLDKRSPRFFRMALSWGYILKTRAAGWKLFCERRHFPPFARWKRKPGWDRLYRALETAEKAAFSDEEFIAFFNGQQSNGEAKLTISPFAAAATASALDWFFKESVREWGGEPE